MLSLFSFLNPKTDPILIRGPRVSFLVYCIKSKTHAYCGMDLKKPNGTTVGTLKCPCCNGTYKLRIKQLDDKDLTIKVGRRHTFTITAINRKAEVRDF